MSPIQYGIVGAGWRSEFYLRIMKAMPERFEITGMVIRNPEKRPRFELAQQALREGRPIQAERQPWAA